MTAAVAKFPRARKRGAKVRKGPAAVVLAFPAQLTGDALRARWSWLKDHAGDWRQEESQGTYTDPKDWITAARLASHFIPLFEGVEFTEGYMRRSIQTDCARIEKRVLVKDWLGEMGIDWTKHKTPEDALFFLHEKFNCCATPGAA